VSCLHENGCRYTSNVQSSSMTFWALRGRMRGTVASTNTSTAKLGSGRCLLTAQWTFWIYGVLYRSDNYTLF